MNMTKPIVSFAREFQIWSYNVGHGELLLRSPKIPSLPTRIDILFKDVRAMELRTRITGLSIEEAQPGDIMDRGTKLVDTMEKGHKVYLIKTQDWIGCLIAGAVFWHEDQGEYGQPSAL